MVQFRTLIPFLLLLVLAGCKERVILSDRYQQFVVSRFDIPLTSRYSPPADIRPNALIVKVSGEVNQNVVLKIYKRGKQLTDTTAIREPILIKGGDKYRDKEFRSDYYSPDELMLLLSPSSPNTTGKLNIEWSL